MPWFGLPATSAARGSLDIIHSWLFPWIGMTGPVIP